MRGRESINSGLLFSLIEPSLTLARVRPVPVEYLHARQPQWWVQVTRVGQRCAVRKKNTAADLQWRSHWCGACMVNQNCLWRWYGFYAVSTATSVWQLVLGGGFQWLHSGIEYRGFLLLTIFCVSWSANTNRWVPKYLAAGWNIWYDFQFAVIIGISFEGLCLPVLMRMLFIWQDFIRVKYGVMSNVGLNTLR